MTDKADQFLELKEELEQHPFSEVSQHRTDINNARWILRRNFDLLKKFTEDTAEDKYSVMTGHLSEKIRVQEELYRLTHNYLASYYTLYELTVTFRDSKFNEESEDRYYELMDKHNIRPISDFLVKLRNYIQHQGVIEQTRHYEWNREDNEELTQVVLFTKDLLEADAWNRNAEDFIRNQEESIRLVDVIESHHSDIENFHNDLSRVVMDEYEDEFEDYTQKQNKMNQIIEENLQDFD